MSTPAPVRRSTRARHEPIDLYQDELKVLAAKAKASPKTKSRDPDSDEEEDVDIIQDSSSMEEEEEDFGKQTPNKKRSPSNKQKQPTPKKKRVIQVKTSTPKKSKVTTVSSSARPLNRRGVQAAFTQLAKKVLDDETETPETSLVAALLHSCKPIPGFPNKEHALHESTHNSIYTLQLEAIARKYVQDSNPNALHCHLLNLIFRSVGGSVETNLDLDKTIDLEDLDDSQWDDLISNVVQQMRETDANKTLLTAAPSKQAAVQEYRKVYPEFWYRLGKVILSGVSSSSSISTSGSTSSSEPPPPPFTSSRFQVETVRDIVTRITELVPVGQPDLRAAATMAVLQLAHACLERTVELEGKLATAIRQHHAAAKSNAARKMQMIQQSMDDWKRHKLELEELVVGPVLTGVFMHRYRDSNPFIRGLCLEALSQMTTTRPDLFLMDKYLKYMGWMCSDKVASVRLAGLKGLTAPFLHYQQQQESAQPDKLLAPLKIDLHQLANVCTKFLARFVDCTQDLDTDVQEQAMELLLHMLRNEFLDDWDVMEETAWDHVNLKALDVHATPKVRKNALYFILEQLDCFDSDDLQDEGKTSADVPEKKQMERVEGIASWIANKLCDGDIPIDKIRVPLADLVIQSLKAMPEHKCLTTNWSAMLRAIRSENPQQDARTGREELAKQRVLLRMLACAAELSVKDPSAGESKKRKKEVSPPEILSIALLKSLPHLLIAFKGDGIALQSITQLPRYLQSSVFSLPSRKNELHSLVKNLCGLFLESTDETVLQHISVSLAFLVEGDHARTLEVKAQISKLSGLLQERLMELFHDSDPQSSSPSKPKSPKKGRKSKTSPKRKSNRLSDTSTVSSSADDDLFAEAASPAVDVENSILLCLKRWRILTKHCPVEYLFDEKEQDLDEEMEGFCNTVAEAMAKRLEDRKPIVDDDEQDDAETVATEKSIRVPEIWIKEDSRIHGAIAKSVDEALVVLLSITAWKLRDALLNRSKTEFGKDGDNESDDEVDVEDLTVLSMRDRLVKLLGVCFDQFLEQTEDTEYTEEHVEFASHVQAAAGRVASDIRTLFPKEWSNAVDPVRQALALTNDSQLIGGFARYLKQREDELRALATKSKEDTLIDEPANKEDVLVNDLLLPLARGLTANWNDGSRREAGIVLAHITGSGSEATHVVQAMARQLKKINPVRFLEAEMACLRLSFEKWVNNEPEELETDRPSEEQLNQYEEAERKHEALFHLIEQQATQLSRCLGVGKITDKKLSRALLGFLQEGVRFAFHGDKGEEDELVLGSRLPFLLILCKYSAWIKKDKQQMALMRENLNANEEELRAHPEFDDVHEDDLAALARFRESLGIKVTRFSTQNSAMGSPNTQGDYTLEDDRTDGGATATPSPGAGSTVSGRRRISTAGSHMSRMSAQSSLSPLPEEDAVGDSNEEEEDSPPKRRRLAGSQRSGRGDSLGSSITMSTAMAKSQSRIDEEEEPGSSEGDDGPFD